MATAVTEKKGKLARFDVIIRKPDNSMMTFGYYIRHQEHIRQEIIALVKNVYNDKRQELLCAINKRTCELQNSSKFPIVIELLGLTSPKWCLIFTLKARRQYKQQNYSYGDYKTFRDQVLVPALQEVFSGLELKIGDEQCKIEVDIDARYSHINIVLP